MLLTYQYGGCAVEHVRRHYFPTSGARSACYARIARLIEAGYLSSLRLPSQTGVGSGKTFLMLGPRGRGAVAEELGIPRSEVERSSRAISPFIINHHLATCDFRLAVELAVEGLSLLTLAEYRNDGDLHRHPMTVQDPLTKQELPIIPDAAITVQLADGSTQQFFVEVDRSTMTASRFKAKLYAYLLDASQQPQRVPFLIVARSPERQEEINRWALEQSQSLQADPTIFLSTTARKVTERTIFTEPIWQVAGGPNSFALLPPNIAHAIQKELPGGSHQSLARDPTPHRYEGSLVFKP